MVLSSLETLKDKLSKAKLWDSEVEFRRWEYIKSENSVDTNLYFVEKGCVRVFFSEDAHEHSLYFGHKGSLLSALDSFLSNRSSDITIQCINKTKVKVISKTTFESFLQKDQSATNLWQNILIELTHWHFEREKDLLIHSPILRYERVLKRQPLLFQNIPHKYIASYLRMSPETFSRILNS